MKLYDFPFSPNCRKVRALAYELGVPLDHEYVDLLHGGSRTPAHLARNPNGRVPVLADGDLTLWESNAILAYIAGKQRSPLLPTDVRARAEVDRWLFWQTAHLSPAIGKVAFERIVKKLTGQGTPDPNLIEAGTAEFARLTALFDAALADREFVAGPLSIADFAIASHYSIAPTCGLGLDPYPRAKAWLDRLLGRESWKRALADAHAAM